MAGRKSEHVKVREQAQPVCDPDGAAVPEEDFTEEEWQFILKRSRELVPEDDLVIVEGPAW